MESELLAYEKLDCFRLAKGVALWAAEQSIPAHRKHLRDQLGRAADSVVLNIAEAAGREGPSRRNFYSIARGSAAEVVAAIGLLPVAGAAEKQAEMRRVYRMLVKMVG
jgi:four helix bundle protein